MSDQSENPQSSATDEQTPQPAADVRVTVDVAVTSSSPAADDFARQAEEAPMGLLAEFWDFLKHEKKWWLTPIIVVLLALAALIIISPAAAPFIYPFF
jgi:hypothetical protein